jgi:hypothetical protein
MYKKCKVVMLPTSGNRSGVWLNRGDKTLYHYANHGGDINHHLYILSDYEIKEGDYVVANYEFNNKSIAQIKYITESKMFCNIGYDLMTNRNKKIIASTDSSLEINISRPFGVTQTVTSIPQSFIEHYVSEYNKGNKIEEVMVEYDEHVWQDVRDIESAITLKLNPDNTINIKSVKESWTKEEVRGLLEQFVMDSDDRNKYPCTISEWIESSL